MKTLKADFTFSSSLNFYSAALPAGAVVDQIMVIVDSAFNGTPTIAVTSSAGTCVATTDTDLTLADRFEFPQSYASITTIDAQFVAGGASAGAGRVLIHYSIPE
jgi:hypothetical protein